MNPTPQCPSPAATNIYKLKMSFPDGSVHEFRPYGYTDHQQEGYYNIRPDGFMENCSVGGQWTTNDLTYFSTDGTFLKLVIKHNPAHIGWWNNEWTLYFPDGGRVTGNEPGSSGQRIYDRNNNYFEFQGITYNNHPALKLVDQLGRWVILEFGSGPGQDSVHEQGTAGQVITWTVKWATVNVSNKKYYTVGVGAYHRDEPPYLEPLSVTLDVVTQVILPQQAPGLDYSFTYNPGVGNPSYGWGELNSITLPTGSVSPRAQAAYHYALDGLDAPNDLVDFQSVTQDQFPTQKALTYLREYDGSTSPTTETWNYSIFPRSGFSAISQPDGGGTQEFYYRTDPPSNLSGHVYKTIYDDGKVVERIWQENKPNGAPLIHTGVNPFVKTEFISVRGAGGALVKTAIKDYKYDKNGNVTQVAEYDWVDYSAVPRTAGEPTGVPAGLNPKRVTVNTYYSATPDASDSSTDDPGIYLKPTSPRLKRAIDSSETRSDFSAGSVLSRSESFYDNPSTTGNVTLEKRWDSIKGGISRPLGAGNSISVTNQYDTFGNRTHTTDAKNVTTLFVYGSINGHENLYVTETKVALGTPVQRWTKQSYDFHTGLVTQSTDEDNNVTNRTTYDIFGRPILVEEADGIAGVEKHTATEYSDTERRVIVRSDLNTTGDGKLIAVQHYDQLGRICLTRRLESGNPAEATDKTKGSQDTDPLFRRRCRQSKWLRTRFRSLGRQFGLVR
jgi:hypothetical protein